MTRADYCPLVNEPCQSLCETPCTARKPLTEEQIAEAVFDFYLGPNRQEVADACFEKDLWIARAIERAHQITQKDE